MRKKLLSLFIAVLCMSFLAVPVFANSQGNHVGVAPNGTGDLLIYPLYTALDGFNTNFSVINTSNTRSVVAKVVLRSPAYSQEVLDFLIYLSPNDEFKGTIKFKWQNYVLTSSDDSLCIAGECANATNPKSIVLHSPCDGKANDSAGYGYIEVIEAWSAQLPKDKNKDETVPKADIIAAYRAAAAGGNTINSLTGYGEVVFPGKYYSAYRATVLKDYDNQAKLNIGVETFLGDQANNNLCELEATLAKNNLVIPYYNTAEEMTIPIITFPTKLSTCPPLPPAKPTARGPFFQENYSPTYEMRNYDMSEHGKELCNTSPCPETSIKNEVVPLAIAAPFSEGWAKVSFDQSIKCTDISGGEITYTGAPVTGLIAEVTSNGLGLLPLTYDYGTVSYNGQDMTGAYQLAMGAGAAPAPPQAQCDADHLNLCTTEADCTGAGGYWYNDKCNAKPQAQCDADHLNLCTTEADCTGAGGYWYNDKCNAKMPDCTNLDKKTCSNTPGCAWSENPITSQGSCILDCGQFNEASCKGAFDGKSCRWLNVFGSGECVPKQK